jgi:hypothetical protein
MKLRQMGNWKEGEVTIDRSLYTYFDIHDNLSGKKLF